MFTSTPFLDGAKPLPVLVPPTGAPPNVTDARGHGQVQAEKKSRPLEEVTKSTIVQHITTAAENIMSVQ